MRWPPFEHVLFDCDSTLTAIEGIDALAARRGAGGVPDLTSEAMEGRAPLEEVYGRRLTDIAPTRAEVARLRDLYKANVLDDAAGVISALGGLGHSVYVVSSGLLEPVREFAVSLGIPADHVRAVDLTYDELSGKWWSPAEPREGVWDADYLEHEPGPLTTSKGKADIVRQLLAGRRGRSMLVGDGVGDLAAAPVVDLFVGFGGVVTRMPVVERAPVFVAGPGLAAVLPLAAGPAARRRGLW